MLTATTPKGTEGGVSRYGYTEKAVRLDERTKEDGVLHRFDRVTSVGMRKSKEVEYIKVSV